MPLLSQRLAAAATAFTLSLALIAGTVQTPAPIGAPVAQQEMI